MPKLMNVPVDDKPKFNKMVLPFVKQTSNGFCQYLCSLKT
jgi:hypothetical protein